MNTLRILDVRTDFGDDPDDVAAAHEYIHSESWDKIYIVITSGDTEARLLVFEEMFREMFESEIWKQTSKNTFQNEHGATVYLFVGDKTNRKMNVQTPHITPLFTPVHQSEMEVLPEHNYDLLIVAPLVGCVVKSVPRKCVVVGSNPESTAPKSVNTGSGLNETELKQSNANFKVATQCSNVIFLNSTHTRVHAPKFNATVISGYTLPHQNQCYSVITNFLLGPRPFFLPADVQKRVAKANASTIEKIVDIVHGQDALKISNIDQEMAEEYCKKRIGDDADDDDVDNTASISACIHMLTGYRLTNNLEGPIPEHAKQGFVDLMKQHPEVMGTPNYDGYGYKVLSDTKLFDHLLKERDEFSQIM